MEGCTFHNKVVNKDNSEKSLRDLLSITVLLGFLAAAITYRIISTRDLDTSSQTIQKYEEVAKGRDYNGLMQDRSVIRKVIAQSLHDEGRTPTPEEVQSKVGELANSSQLQAELQSQRSSFLTFIDVVIYCLIGIIGVSVVVYLRRRRNHLD